MNSLQYELDSCWAVFGEVYGRFYPLSQLGFTLRRIRSDLDETGAEVIAGDFVRNRFSFESAGAELLKIFAEPLYGVNPNFSVRELVQNAVDAVLEMRALAEKGGYVVPMFKQESDVVVSLCGNEVDGYIAACR